MNAFGNVVREVVGIQEDGYEDVSLKDLSYTVTLSKKDGGLGLAYRAEDEKEGGRLIVTGIVQRSAVQDWNKTCESEVVICVGDHVKAVNGKTGARAMVDEMKLDEAEFFNIELLKFGPRWHVTGVVAECMEKIELCMDKGMRMVPIRRSRGEAEEDLDPDQRQAQERPSLSFFQNMLVLGASLTPNLILLGMLSDVGYGIKMYEKLAPKKTLTMGQGIVFLSFLFAVSLLIVDWSRWKSKMQKKITMTICCYGFLLGGCLMARNMPELPLVIVLMHVPVLLGGLRATALKAVRRPSFYGGVGMCLMFISLMSLTLWLVWMNVPGVGGGTHRWTAETRDDLRKRSEKLYSHFPVSIGKLEFEMVADWYCHETDGTPDRVLDYDYYEITGKMQALETDCGWDGCIIDKDDVSKIKKVCAQVKTAWILIWAAPFICFGSNFLFCLFCVINGSWLRVTDLNQLEKALKNFLLIVTMAAAGGWVSISVAGASTRLTGALLSFSGAGVTLLFIWMYLEIGEHALTAALKNSTLMKRTLDFARSDWVRAVIIVPVYLFVPIILFLNFLTQRARRLRDPMNTEKTWFTSGANTVFDALQHWRWVRIMYKANLLAILYWTLVSGAGKFAIVFLSWLNEYLKLNVGFEESCVVFFIVGFLMFMLPPVPGIPVYWCAGIIVVAQARPVEGIGYYGGTMIAVALCVCLKLVAACGQYMIGFFLGQSLKVQQLVGVDKVPIKGIEMILKTKGLNAAKVAVLLGGPDWPTSVLCGILRVNIPQMLLGTSPIVLLCAPSVLYGAFLVTPIEDETDTDGRSVWNTMASMMLMMSALSQLTAMCCALYFMQDRVFKHEEELKKPRPEHAKITALTESERAYNEAYDSVTDWRALPICLKILIQSALACMIMQGMMLTFADSLCFLPFKVNNSIGASHDEEGLNNDVLSFIKPLGRFAMFLFFLGCMLHVLFVQITGRMATKELKRRQEAEKLEQEDRPPDVGSEKKAARVTFAA